MPLLPLWAFMAGYRVILTFLLAWSNNVAANNVCNIKILTTGLNTCVFVWLRFYLLCSELCYFFTVDITVAIIVTQLIEALCYKPEVAGSVPGGVSEIFHWLNPYGGHSATNKHDYQVFFLGGKAADA
jgi:hypothetical protein